MTTFWEDALLNVKQARMERDRATAEFNTALKLAMNLRPTKSTREAQAIADAAGVTMARVYQVAPPDLEQS